MGCVNHRDVSVRKDGLVHSVTSNNVIEDVPYMGIVTMERVFVTRDGTESTAHWVSHVGRESCRNMLVLLISEFSHCGTVSG